MDVKKRFSQSKTLFIDSVGKVGTARAIELPEAVGTPATVCLEYKAFFWGTVAVVNRKP